MNKNRIGGGSWMKLAGKYSYILVFVLFFLIYIISSSGLTWAGAMNIFRHSAVVGIIALGMGLICLTGEIDLSVGSMLALDSGFSVVIFNLTGSIAVTLVFALLFGAVCGILNGFLIGYIGMPAFIVTLATMLVYRSFAQYFCQRFDKALLGGGSSVYRMTREAAGYDAMYGFGNGRLLTLPIVGILLILFTVVFVYLVNNTKYGKKVYAVGSNTKGALMAGINVNLMKISVFTIAGLLVGVSSFLWIAMNASSDPATTGSSYEMYAIAAVVLGGISMAGGKGDFLGIFFGALSYTVIDKIIVALKMDSLINDAVKGIILILVIMVQYVGPKLRERLAVARKGAAA